MWQPEIESMSRGALAAHQLQLLRRQVRRCYRLSPFYRRKLDAAGVRPDQIQSLADVHRLPFTTREEFQDQQLRRPPMGEHTTVPPGRWREVHPTTGGNPAYVAWSQPDLAAIGTVTARHLYACGIRPGDLIHNTLAYGLWPGGLALHYGSQTLGACVIPAGMDALKRQIEILVNFKPRVLVSMPSAALYLAEQLCERGLGPADTGLEIGIFAGEPGTGSPTTRSRLEAALGIRAFDLYGIAEVGPAMAGECRHQNGLHWPEDHYLVEIIDPETLTPCRPGEAGVLVLTDLTRTAMPFLRYWTNDCATLTTEPCPCGRTLARSPGGIAGRFDQMIIYRGAKFYPLQVAQVLHQFPELGEEFRAVLERDASSWLDHCTLMVEQAPSLAAWELAGLAARVERQVEEDLHVPVAVQVVRYGSLERTVTKGGRVQDRRSETWSLRSEP